MCFCHGMQYTPPSECLPTPLRWMLAFLLTPKTTFKARERVRQAHETTETREEPCNKMSNSAGSARHLWVAGKYQPTYFVTNT